MKKLTKEQLKKAINQSVSAHKSGVQQNSTVKNMTFSLPSKTESSTKGPRKHLRKV